MSVTVEGLNFAADSLLSYWRSPAATDGLVAGGGLPFARINHVRATEGGGAAEILQRQDAQKGSAALRQYVDSVVADFQASWTPEQYLAENTRQWEGLHEQLLQQLPPLRHGRRERMAGLLGRT